MQIILPSETQAREYDAKLLLAGFAAERGHSIIIGSKKAINARIAEFPKSIYVSKALTARNWLIYSLLERLGHAIVCGDEEGLVYATRESYIHHKVSAVAFRKADALLAWGSENAAMWREYEAYHGVPIHETGNARLDLLRPELRALYDQEAQALRDRFAPFVLINTNFSRLNHYLPGQSRQAKKLDAAGPDADPGERLDLGLAAHKAVLLDYFLEMIPAIAKAFPDHTVVIRPHPSEKQETWHNEAKGLSNVKILNEGNIVPWLLAADAVIHNGCTTAVETYLLGGRAVAYQPATSDQFDLQLPNLLSHRAFDLETLLATLKAKLDGSLQSTPEDAREQDALAKRFIATLGDGAFACDKIVDAIEDIAQKVHKPTVLPIRLGAQIVARVRRRVQQVEAHIPGHHNNAVYVRHMFPGITLEGTQARLARYGQMLGRFEGVEVIPRFENILEVRPVGG